MNTNEETTKVEVYERVLHDIHLFRNVTCNENALLALIDTICQWSYAHRCGNGELTCEEQQAEVNHYFKKLQQRKYRMGIKYE
jgi:hypothetical protein